MEISMSVAGYPSLPSRGWVLGSGCVYGSQTS